MQFRNALLFALVLIPTLAFGHATIAHEEVVLIAGGEAEVAPANAKRLLLVVQASLPTVNCLPAGAYDDSADGVLNVDTVPVLVQVPDSALALHCVNRDTENSVTIDWTEIVAP